MSLPPKMKEILFSESMPFISLATCDASGQPNAALKILLRSENGEIYFVDVPYGQTYENLKTNPKISFSFYDQEALRCYKIFGTAEIIEKGAVRERMAKQIEHQLREAAVNRIIEGLQRGGAHKAFMIDVPKQFILLKVTVEKIFEYGIQDPTTRTVTIPPKASGK